MIFRFKVFLIFINILSLQNIFANNRTTAATCRSHFAQNDILNQFTENEKNSLETAVRSLADLLGKPEAEYQQLKIDLDASILKFIENKKLSAQKKLVFQAWLAERILFYIDAKKKLSYEIAAKNQSHTKTLEAQKETIYTHVQKINDLKEKYNVQTLSEVLIVAEASGEHARPNCKEDILFALNNFEFLEITPEVFFIVAMQGSLAAVDWFLERGVDVSAIDSNLHTALHLAARYNPDPEVVSRLIQRDHGAHLNATDWNLNTPLHFAAANPNPKILEVLLDFGAKTTYKNKEDNLALHAAAINSKMKGPIFSRLLKATGLSNKNLRNIWKETALLLAVQAKNTEVVKELLAAGVDTSLPYKLGMTALHIASLESTTPFEIFQLLILANHGEQLHALSEHDEYPLHTAVQHIRDPKVIEFMIQAGARAHLDSSVRLKTINAASEKNTPLHLAVENSIEILQVLLRAGANPTLKNAAQQTAYDVARKTYSTSIYTHSEKLENEQKSELLYEAMEKWKRTHR